MILRVGEEGRGKAEEKNTDGVAVWGRSGRRVLEYIGRSIRTLLQTLLSGARIEGQKTFAQINVCVAID